MTARRVPPNRTDPYRLAPERLRWRCDPGEFPFETTEDMQDCPIHIIGQNRAMEALRLGLSMGSEGYNIFVTGDVGSGRSTVVKRMLQEVKDGQGAPSDLAYVHNFQDTDEPRRLIFPAGRARKFAAAMDDFIESLGRDLRGLFESEAYRRQRAALVDATTRDQKNRLKEFEKRVQEQGFALVQVQMGPLTRPQLVPLVAGNPVDMDQLETLVDQGQFKREEYEALGKRRDELGAEMESLGKAFRDADRELRRRLADLDRELARPLVEEAARELGAEYSVPGVDAYLDQVAEDVLARLPTFRETHEATPAEGESEGASPEQVPRESSLYRVNVVVDNGKTRGRPIIWETTPSYRNLFGTIEKVRTPAGEFVSDHMHIRGGSLQRASGGILVLDAIDVLVEPGVWAALKRTLRNRSVEIQTFDPLHLFSVVSLKPEAVPVDVKVIMIGTRHIYQLLYHLDEDFKKIFKVKAEFAMYTPLSDEELANFANFVHKKVQDDRLPPFHRDAVAAIVEQGVRMTGDQGKLTTRFTEIADLIREAGYWARRENAPRVREKHVELSLAQQAQRVSMVEEIVRERIAQGTVLIDLGEAKVGQVNGLALLDLGDHEFAQPSRITATTAMGRNGIIDIEREAAMSGPVHTKGMLILSGFLRERFAQRHPLALTASLCFEQNYGGIEGDSASCAELYALLSSLSGAPLRQDIAVTGSVNQKGEVQPIGGVNRKVEGFFDLCRLVGLSGTQGVLIPRRNERNLMLRKDVVDSVRQGKFHVFAVSTIEEGLRVLARMEPGERAADGAYPPQTLYSAVDERLRQLADEVQRFGPADLRLER
jgi:lon-related putative ATP-dependent protease